MSTLNAENAYIFRITHLENVPWILDNGLHCRNSANADPNFRNIGIPGLIQNRHARQVPIPPGGTLSDYVPFYFTPWSIMMLNIKTGYGVKTVPNKDIVILVSSLRNIAGKNIPFVFTNQHAYPVTAQYYDKLADLDKIDWALLKARDFKHDPEDPGKKERYQAEALIQNHLPITDLLGIACHNDQVTAQLQAEVNARRQTLQITTRPNWYF